MKRTAMIVSALAILASMGLPLNMASVAQAQSAPESPDHAADDTPWFVTCHWTGEDYRLISFPMEIEVPQSWFDEHRSHGDRYPGEQIPGTSGPGKYLDEDCDPVSLLLGTTFSGCVTEAASSEPCLRSEPDGADGGSTATADDPSASLFASDSAVVQDPGVEFSSADGSIEADFDGDYLTVTVAPGQPALQFAFNFGAWDLWDFERGEDSTLEVRDVQSGGRDFILETASTEGASTDQSVTYRLEVEHSAGISAFRNTVIDVEPETLSADGVSTAIITVELRDLVGNPPEEERVVELFMNQQFGTIGPVTHVEGGTYTATLTAGEAPGTARIVGMVDFLDLDQTVGTVVLTAP